MMAISSVWAVGVFLASILLLLTRQLIWPAV